MCNRPCSGDRSRKAQVAFLQAAGAQVAQTVNLATGQYALSFSAAQRGNYQFGTQIIQVLVDGVAVGQYQPAGTAYASYQTGPFAIAAPGNHTIALKGIGSGTDFTAFVDSITLSTVSALAEPTTTARAVGMRDAVGRRDRF